MKRVIKIVLWSIMVVFSAYAYHFWRIPVFLLVLSSLSLLNELFSGELKKFRDRRQQPQLSNMKRGTKIALWSVMVALSAYAYHFWRIPVALLVLSSLFLLNELFSGELKKFRHRIF